MGQGILSLPLARLRNWGWVDLRPRPLGGRRMANPGPVGPGPPKDKGFPGPLPPLVYTCVFVSSKASCVGSRSSMGWNWLT